MSDLFSKFRRDSGGIASEGVGSACREHGDVHGRASLHDRLAKSRGVRVGKCPFRLGVDVQGLAT
jgi:hypothetical protein